MNQLSSHLDYETLKDKILYLPVKYTKYLSGTVNTYMLAAQQSKHAA